MMHRLLVIGLSVGVLASCVAIPAAPGDPADTPVPSVRVAVFNAALAADTPDAIRDELDRAASERGYAVAEVIRATRADILLINELDHDAGGNALAALAALLTGDDGQPLYGHTYTAPVNTGHPSGFDLDGDGNATGPADAWGYGAYPGQYGMAVLSKFPIDIDQVRTFQHLKWRDRPGHRMPAGFFPPAAEADFPLSSKSHWDVPIQIGGHVLHLLACHPTPPVFDGPEDRNGRRNADEIGFWTDYLTPGRAAWIVDDADQSGGLAADALFVVAGDLNNDPDEGDGDRAAITALLTHPRITDPHPTSAGGPAAGNDADDTAGWGKRVDYVLPSRGLKVVDAGVFWPAPGEPLDDEAKAASDHRLVWVDVRPPPAAKRKVKSAK